MLGGRLPSRAKAGAVEEDLEEFWPGGESSSEEPSRASKDIGTALPGGSRGQEGFKAKGRSEKKA